MNSVLNKLDVVRTKAYEDAYATDVGRNFYENIQKELDFSPEEAKESLQQLVDGFMFAGMLGTTHLVTHTLERIRARPDVYVAAWKKNTRSFLLESARVDPPVTSVTAVLGEGKFIFLEIWNTSCCVQAVLHTRSHSSSPRLFFLFFFLFLSFFFFF